MRKEFAESLITLSKTNNKIIFLTGDLGFGSFEGLRDQLGERFINAGVSEQNMATMAAAIAYEGFIPFIYSISPFITLKPYEQLRNDVCHPGLPVKIVANGGGYGYGLMGSTHHNIEDIGCMRILPNMKVFVPYTKEDVHVAVQQMVNSGSPNYLRLNLASSQENIPTFSQWRKIKKAEGGCTAIVISTGSVTDNLFQLPGFLRDDMEVWLLSEFPVHEIPSELIKNINRVRKVITMEEHQGQCGLHETLASLLLKKLTVPIGYYNLFASGYPSGKYGSQKWHQEENSLAGKNLENKITAFISHSHVS